MKEKEAKRKYKEKAEKDNRTVSVYSCEEESSAAPRLDLKMNWAAFIRYYNSVLTFYGSSIEPLKRISRGYRARIQQMVNEEGEKNFLGDAITNMAKSDFLNGRKEVKGQRFIASFTWLFGDNEHFDRVADGFYNDPPAAELSPEEQRQQELERYRAQQEARRAEVRRIDEEEIARREAERDSWAKTSCTYEEYQRLLKEGKIEKLNN